MTDEGIRQYLERNKWSVKAQECIVDIFNTSQQIINKYYDFDTDMATIITPHNSFTFKWILGNP